MYDTQNYVKIYLTGQTKNIYAITIVLTVQCKDKNNVSYSWQERVIQQSFPTALKCPRTTMVSDELVGLLIILKQ